MSCSIEWDIRRATGGFADVEWPQTARAWSERAAEILGRSGDLVAILFWECGGGVILVRNERGVSAQILVDDEELEDLEVLVSLATWMPPAPLDLGARPPREELRTGVGWLDAEVDRLWVSDDPLDHAAALGLLARHGPQSIADLVRAWARTCTNAECARLDAELRAEVSCWADAWEDVDAHTVMRLVERRDRIASVGALLSRMRLGSSAQAYIENVDRRVRVLPLLAPPDGCSDPDRLGRREATLREPWAWWAGYWT